jgi:hypothetical protein
MSATWQRSQPIVFRSTSSSTALDTRFPRAVSGEAYDRFARAMWPQAQRWIRKHSYRFAGVDLTVDDAHDVLHTAASIDLARPLYAQEQRLLSELLHTEWTHLTQSAEIVPEIPTFLLTRR